MKRAAVWARGIEFLQDRSAKRVVTLIRYEAQPFRALCGVVIELGERTSAQTKNGRKFIAIMATVEALRGFTRARSEATP
jgi:hypothetical protein